MVWGQAPATCTCPPRWREEPTTSRPQRPLVFCPLVPLVGTALDSFSGTTSLKLSPYGSGDIVLRMARPQPQPIRQHIPEATVRQGQPCDWTRASEILWRDSVELRTDFFPPELAGTSSHRPSQAKAEPRETTTAQMVSSIALRPAVPFSCLKPVYSTFQGNPRQMVSVTCDRRPWS